MELKELERQRDSLYSDNRYDPAEVAHWVGQLREELAPYIISIMRRYASEQPVSSTEVAIAELIDAAIWRDADNRFFP